MAVRLQAPELLKNLRYFTRTLNSASSTSISAVTPLNFTEKHEPTIEKPAVNRANSSILDINDHKKLFSLLSTTKILRAALNLHLAAVEPLVDFGIWVMNSRVMEIDLAREVVMGTIRHSFYEHFCAGESASEAQDCIRKVNESGLRGMLVYAVEHTDDVQECQQNMQGFLQTVQSAKSLPPDSASFVIVKISAICPMRLLKRVSDLLRWQQRDPSFNLPWKLNTFPIFSGCSPLYHTLQKPEPLTLEEENELQLAHQRLQKLCQECLEANVPLTVDAEDTIVQPAIDYLTYNAAILNSKEGKPIVYNTMQAYLKDAKERLFLATEAAEKMGVPMGFKLVRGAYMSSESKVAAALGCDSPIHNSIQETHNCYNDCASYMLDKIADGSGAAVVLATHNVESGQLAAAKATDLGIKGNQKLEFAQLYGMAEALSFGLKNAGFQVSKYMPYGPVDKIIPYLLRRAEENRGFLSASNLDRQLLRKELLRRDEAIKVGGANHSHATQDLYDSIAAGNYPEWKLYIQTIDPDHEDRFDFDPLDVTKTWPEDILPLQPVGRLVLNKNIDNFFAENEQLAFCPAIVVPGIYYSNDKLLQTRVFSYSDTQRHRLGPNYLQLPVNAPKCAHHNNHYDGFMNFMHRDEEIDYFPSRLDPVRHAERFPTPPEICGGKREKCIIPKENNFKQPGERYRSWAPDRQERFICRWIDALSDPRVTHEIRSIWISYWSQACKSLGQKLASRLNVRPNI